MTVTLHITKKAKFFLYIPGLRTHKQEFGSCHRDSRRCCQTHVFLPTQISPANK